MSLYVISPLPFEVQREQQEYPQPCPVHLTLLPSLRMTESVAHPALVWHGTTWKTFPSQSATAHPPSSQSHMEVRPSCMWDTLCCVVPGQKNDSEKELERLRRAHQQQQAVLQRYQSHGAKMAGLESTVRQQEKVSFDPKWQPYHSQCHHTVSVSLNNADMQWHQHMVPHKVIFCSACTYPSCNRKRSFYCLEYNCPSQYVCILWLHAA